MNYDRIILELLDRVSALEDEVAALKAVSTASSQADATDTPYADDNAEYYPIAQGGRDTTKYLLDGKAHGKNRLVLAVVQKYVKEHPKQSAEDLMKVFDKSLQGSLGVIREVEDAKRSYKDPARRFFMTDGARITTTTKECVVCTQWGIDNINRLIKRARQLGMEIEEVRR